MTSETGSNHKWMILVIACLAQFMVVLDNTIVNVALPSIQRGLSFSATNLQWVVDGYTLMFGGFLMLGGRAADLLGRRRLFIAGIILFSAASLVNGFAQSSGMLIVGRGIQGLGGALVSPAALSIIMTTFQDTGERTKALGVWSGIAAGGAAFGLLLGGILTDLVSWRWNFFVNVPVGIGSVLLALRYVPESKAELGHRKFDALGAASVTGGLLVLVFGIVKAETWGWGSGKTIAVLAAGIATLALFVWLEARSAAPLVKLSIFKIRTIATSNVVMLLAASALFGMFFFASLYVQDVLGYSPLKAGLAFLPVSLGIMLGAGVAQGIVARAGVRNVAVVGLVLAAVGILYLTQLPVNGSYLTDLFPGLVAMAIGMGLVFVPITLLATSGVSNDDSGLASGLFNSSQQVGGSLGLAVLSTLAASRTSSLLGAHPTNAAQLAAKVSGYHVAFAVAGICLAVGAVLLIVLLRKRHMAAVTVDTSQLVAAA